MQRRYIHRSNFRLNAGMVSVSKMQPFMILERFRYINPNTMASSNKSQRAGTSEMYDFSSPLWDGYFKATRSKARFPRGYKEVSSVTDEDHERQSD